MNWNIDIQTQDLAHLYPVPIVAENPAAQFAGRNLNPENWLNRIRPEDTFPVPPIVSSPQTIIGCFQNGNYLSGLALIVSWGTMWRTNNRIYPHTFQCIHNALTDCALSINNTEAIDDAWGILIDRLQWSSVIASKTLHFLCRALEIDNDPPVPIDNEVILNKVWRRFKNGILNGQRPESWRGNSLDAYLRYMTAILTWANLKGWTTIQIESTLFNEYRNA